MTYLIMFFTKNHFHPKVNTIKLYGGSFTLKYCILDPIMQIVHLHKDGLAHKKYKSFFRIENSFYEASFIILCLS